MIKILVCWVGALQGEEREEKCINCQLRALLKKSDVGTRCALRTFMMFKCRDFPVPYLPSILKNQTLSIFNPCTFLGITTKWVHIKTTTIQPHEFAYQKKREKFMSMPINMRQQVGKWEFSSESAMRGCALFEWGSTQDQAATCFRLNLSTLM